MMGVPLLAPRNSAALLLLNVGPKFKQVVEQSAQDSLSCETKLNHFFYVLHCIFLIKQTARAGQDPEISQDGEHYGKD